MSGYDPRRRKLYAIFQKNISGDQTPSNTQSARLFVEAICDQDDHVECVERLISSRNGISALRSALRVDSSSNFLNISAAGFLRYLQEPSLAHVCSGLFLQKLVRYVATPSFLLDALISAQEKGQLDDSTEQCLAWFLLQLVSLPIDQARTYHSMIESGKVLKDLTSTSQVEVRILAQKIRHILETFNSPQNALEDGPGGRHNNDFSDFRQISVLPTVDELASKDPPFLRQAVAIDECQIEGRFALHLDSQFRLLREDMLRSLREDLQIILGSKSGRSKCFKTDDLVLDGIHCTDRFKWAVKLRCRDDFKQLPKSSHDLRMKYLKDNRKFIAHESLGCLLINGKTLAALVTVHRDEDLLAEALPVLCVQLSGPDGAISRALLDLKAAETIQLLLLNTAVFAYEPVLRQLQITRLLPLKAELLDWEEEQMPSLLDHSTSPSLRSLFSKLQSNAQYDISENLELPQKVLLDESQARSFQAGINQRVSAIQGPPGTGKSFIGALVLKAIYRLSTKKILVVCYTNHALDQFLEDLLKVGIPEEEMVRLGSAAKATLKTTPLVISNQKSGFRYTRADWDVIKSQKAESDEWSRKLEDAYSKYAAQRIDRKELMEYLEFLDDDRSFHDAFYIPHQDDGMTLIGTKGKAISKFYLLDRWGQGFDGGILQRHSEDNFPQVWKIELPERKALLTGWKTEILRERVARICEIGDCFNKGISEMNSFRSERDCRILRQKRIIGCTTTAAAKYVKAVQAASPDVLLVEEAGEILESHILTALGPETEQLILIGDHKQLRPKVHHDLSVEKQDGYDLNRSLFERLVLKGYPHETLSRQHRMRPEISALVRTLTYPDLKDAPGTLNRPDLRGFRDNLIFLTHQSPEEEAVAPDWRDGNSTSSKKNDFEAKMILKCVKYLAQQGYNTDQVVVLTPYLAQLRLLVDVLGSENDTVLNDMDSYDLVRAGLMPDATARVNKRGLRISTVDNYQGEECDVVLVSLTRSNLRADIGFLASPERLNVLLSRARDALIIVGNSTMLQEARKGRELWTKFLQLLRDGSHIYDGFPVKCERHPERTAMLYTPEGFDDNCPDGGCMERCKTILRCGIHACPQYCHQLSDHSKMPCDHRMKGKCAMGHVQIWKCFMGPPPICAKCRREQMLAEKRIGDEMERETAQDAEQQLLAKELAALDAQISIARDEISRESAKDQQKAALLQKQRDLEQAQHLVRSIVKSKEISNQREPPNLENAVTEKLKTKEDKAECEIPPSLAKRVWIQQKNQTGTKNDAMDDVMNMTGLEDVKQQFLKIKARVETSRRQNGDMSKERLGVVLLGNPGTGKTTVARLYAKLLTSLGAIPGFEFVETTGSKLANEGVAGARKHVEGILQARGGALFLDEAYQLASGHSHGGAAVLDYLLAEIENQTGKIVFILAGYDKQMEKFFEHNQGFDSRLPYRLRFADYEDDELAIMLRTSIERKYKRNMKVEDGLDGLYIRIVSRRVGRGRGREGFGNARAVENALGQICDRQAERLDQERMAGLQPDDFLFTKVDMLGPDPSLAIPKSTAWEELQGMTGLASVKDAVRVFLDRVKTNYERELAEKPPIEVSLNRVFLGSPGTGKTSVAKLYGRILVDIGLLQSAEVITKDPSDMIGSALGESEKTTKALLKSTEGKVLIIDEAYMLGSSQNSDNATDPYRTAVVDTIVSEIQSTPGEPRCVIMLGYREQMESMFQNVNPGLSRRFPIDEAFNFEDYNDEQLMKILTLKLTKQVLQATDEAKAVAITVLSKARRRPNFGNAGEVENLISRAKNLYQQRLSMVPSSQRPRDVVLEPQDFDPDHDRGIKAIANCRELFQDIIGCEEMVQKIEGMIRSVENMRRRGLDPDDHMPLNFVFKGPSGTGKTTVARKMGRVFYDMGFLASTDVHECSASDLIGQYVGQTGPKTQQLLLKAVGKVLFIDEAYRLGEGHFATEAIDELVDSLTKPRFKGKMIVILAGYEKDINKLLNVNPGLSSRFPDEFMFHNLDPKDCYGLLKQTVSRQNIGIDEDSANDIGLHTIYQLFEKLCNLPSWGNGRDVDTVSARIVRSFFEQPSNDDSSSQVSLSEVKTALEKLFREREERLHVQPQATLSRHNTNELMLEHCQEPNSVHQIPCSTSVETKQPNFTQEITEDLPTAPQLAEERDKGVLDAVWTELELSKADELRIEAEMQIAISNAATEAEARQTSLDDVTQEMECLQSSPSRADEVDEQANERKRRHEELRIKLLKERLEVDEAKEKFRQEREKAEQRHQENLRVQKKLRQMGVCVLGYRWIKQATGFRCAGGSHFVDNAALEIGEIYSK